jgi:glycosyltransferase 2 family protein
MTKPPETRIGPSAAAGKHGGRLLSPARYRHPGDVIRLIIAGLVLAAAVAATAVTHATYAGASAAAVTAVMPPTLAGRVLAGLVQALFAGAAVAAVVVTLRHRRYRLLAGLAGAAALAGAVLAGIVYLAGGERPHVLAAGAGSWWWLTGASLLGPALGAAAVACTVAAAPWLSRPWRRIAWITLWLAAAVRLITGTASPMEVVLAFAAGVTVGAGALVLFGVPDRRIGPAEIAAVLESAGLPVARVEPAAVEAKGSRPFTAVTEDGEFLFVKVLGPDQRDADLLYRAYRFLRLRDVGDTRPAASLIQAAEHQALVAVMAERAGVTVPAIHQVIKADGSALLAMDLVDGSSLDLIPAHRVGDAVIRELWTQVDRLHRARIAHRSLRAANVVIDGAARPWIVDFSFSELGATGRQMTLDIAELLASLAVIAGAGRAVTGAAAVVGRDGVAAAVPLLQPLALSAGTRRAIARQDGLLTKTRAAAAAAGGREDQELARIQRVRPRTLLAIVAAAGAFYYLLPKLAQVGSSWQAVQSADWAWLPLVIALSAVTYLASAVGLIGAVVPPIRFWPTVLAQAASSFVNRVSPANVGGMALNARFLQKSGVDTSAGVAAVGVNSLAGAVAHLVLMAVFFTWAGRGLGKAFRLPSGSKLLLILAIVAAVVGIVLATRPGRRFAVGKLIPGLRSAAASLKRVAQTPGKMIMLFGGSAVITLAYIGALAASVQAFGGGPGIVLIGAVYLGAAALAAAAPSPGGLGAIEAALIAGLTGVGMAAGPAFSAVLLYRLATYWLPIAPGWLAWRALLRREYV